MQGVSQILRINLTKKKCVWEELPAGYGTLAGQSLTAAIVTWEVRPVTDSFGSANPLVLTPPLLLTASMPADTSMAVDGNSTVSPVLREASIIGPVAEKLVRLGLSAVILEGIAKSPVVLSIFNNGITVYQAASLWGSGGHEAADLLRMRHPGAAFVTSGLTAEKELQSAALGVAKEDDYRQEPLRGCLGEVLASKNVRALVLDDNGCPCPGTAEQEPDTGVSKTIFPELRQPLSAVEQSMQNGISLIFNSLLAA